MSSPRLRPVFEGARKPGIFSVPEPRRKLGSPEAYMEETVKRVPVLPQQALLEGGGSLEFFEDPQEYEEICVKDMKKI